MYRPCGPRCLTFDMFSCLRSSLNLNKERRARAANWARVPHQPSETGTTSSQNKAVVTATGGVCVGRGEAASKGVEWRGTSNARGRPSLYQLCADVLKGKEALQDEALEQA